MIGAIKNPILLIHHWLYSSLRVISAVIILIIWYFQVDLHNQDKRTLGTDIKSLIYLLVTKYRPSLILIHYFFLLPDPAQIDMLNVDRSVGKINSGELERTWHHQSTRKLLKGNIYEYFVWFIFPGNLQILFLTSFNPRVTRVPSLIGWLAPA